MAEQRVAHAGLRKAGQCKTGQRKSRQHNAGRVEQSSAEGGATQGSERQCRINFNLGSLLRSKPTVETDCLDVL